jgi:hypothetical protein
MAFPEMPASPEKSRILPDGSTIAIGLPKVRKQGKQIPNKKP